MGFPKVFAVSVTKILAFWFKFFWIERPLIIRFKVKIPLFQLIILQFVESYRQIFIKCAIIMVEVLSHFSPVSDLGSIHDLCANKSTVVL
jgi:hypothetical protein